MKVIYHEEIQRDKLICDNCEEDITKNKMWRAFKGGLVIEDGNYQALDFCSKKCSIKWIKDNITIESYDTEKVIEYKKNIDGEVEYG